MEKKTRKWPNVNAAVLRTAGVFAVLLLGVCLLWHGNVNSRQATPAFVADVYFAGEYRIADGPWRPYVAGEHIPSTQGDVTLRGRFHVLAPDGAYEGLYAGDVPIAFYLDHINLTFYEGDEPLILDVENPIYGDAACCVSWLAFSFVGNGAEPNELRIHNPHTFGNETAIDEMLSRLAFWTGIEFEKDALATGETQREFGLLFMIASLLFLGTALLSSLIHLKSARILWLLGIVMLFAGTYLSYSADGVSFWSESVVTNTTVLGCSMMFYMFFLSLSIIHFMEATKRVGAVTVIALGAANAFFFVLPIFTDIRFYDTWLYWVMVQGVANAVLFGCLIKEFCATKEWRRWLCLSLILPLVAFAVDAMMTALGLYTGGLVSALVFIVFFAVAVVALLRVIPHSINALAKAKELETERIRLSAQLAETRIATMMSQIRPHFIYNTLGSIEQLCKLDPPKAGELVHNFAKYLRGNFGELDNPKPILMSQEMEHVHHYISIENVRFPDMTFTFEMKSEDFRIPALTVQPIVENAIKHGLMKLPRGGTIRVATYETETHYCISVVDDGAGFDTEVLLDERKHLGIRNIRERLKIMVGGTLDIESTIGVGTTVMIQIPKEGRE